LIAVLVLPFVALLLLALVLTLMPLPEPLPAARSSARNLLAAVSVGVLGAAYVLVIAVISVGSFTSRGGALDEILASKGMRSAGHMIFGRRYRGRLDGREVDVRVVPGPSLKPSLVEVSLTAAPGLRAAIGLSRPLLGCRDCSEVARIAPRPSRLRVFAEDHDLARARLGGDTPWRLLETALEGGGAEGSAELYIEEKRLWLRWHPWTVRAGNFDDRLEALLALAPNLEG
jgi:hypothetical protein